MYTQGRTDKKLKVVTNAIDGSSYHTYGLAVDILILIDENEASWDTLKDFDGDTVAYRMEAVSVFKKYGYKCGGDFVSIKEKPHFEKSFGYSVSELPGKYNKKDFIEGTHYVRL